MRYPELAVARTRGAPSGRGEAPSRPGLSWGRLARHQEVIARWARGGTVVAVKAHSRTARLPKAVAERLGRCYELAGREVPGSGGTLVHGSIHHVLVNNRIDHAWIELADGSVWEPISQDVYPPSAFAALFRPTVAGRYSRSEVWSITLETGHWGPWDDEPATAARP